MKRVVAGLLISIIVAAVAFADPSIVEVQQALKDQGFYYGEINGKKDGDTTAAIRRYQIRNGLQINGELNDETLRSIRATQAKAAQSPAAAPSTAQASGSVAPDTSELRAESVPQSRPVNPPADQAVPPPQVDEYEQRPSAGKLAPSVGGVLSGTPYQTAPVEVQRRVIADAQRILARRGLFREEVDGAYSAALEFSLRAYQTRVGLPTTGRLDLETLAALRLLPRSRAPLFTPRRRIMPPEPAVRGEWIRP
jgi:peptidoglycan hydrolase-like protein with peptidoglycan-binding domain